MMPHGPKKTDFWTFPAITTSRTPARLNQRMDRPNFPSPTQPNDADNSARLGEAKFLTPKVATGMPIALARAANARG